MPWVEITPDFVTFPSPVSITVALLTSVGICTALAFMGYFYHNRKTKVIRKASPMFCQLMLIGILVNYVSMFLWDLPVNPFTCLLKVWLPCLGYALVMG